MEMVVGRSYWSCFGVLVIVAQCAATASDFAMVSHDEVTHVVPAIAVDSQSDVAQSLGLIECHSCGDDVATCSCNQCRPSGANRPFVGIGDDGMFWIDHVRVGYDGGFVVASDRELNLHQSEIPFELILNGWGQLRHTNFSSQGPNNDLNQFQLKRGRLAFSGSTFTPDFKYFVQLDGRSSSGDDVRLLDYVLSYDVGRHALGLSKGAFGFRTGKYKMPFTMARWMSGREFEFTDRSMASMFFDVNRSFAWGLYGETKICGVPLDWEVALFNGLVTGGAETGSAGSLDNNFATSGRIFWYPTGDWGYGELADFECHQRLATRVGMGIANSTIDRFGLTEFSSVRVVDSGKELVSLLPLTVDQYTVNLYTMHHSSKYRGWSSTLEYYFRTIDQFQGAPLPSLFDHGFWLQLGKFVIPRRLELLARWSRVQGESGTLGATVQSAEEIAGGFALYFRDQHSKFVVDITKLDGAPINSSSLDISPGDIGWLVRSQVQFAF